MVGCRESWEDAVRLWKIVALNGVPDDERVR